MGLLSLYLGLEQLKDRTIKSSTMSQVLCSTIALEFLYIFQNKTQRFHCMTLSSFSIYVVFVDPHQGNKDVMPFSLPTTKAYILYSQTTDPKRVESYNQINMCMYVKYMVANLILLCSLKTYLSFET
jgi:hypothetical protein